ncbi:MAG TPA: GTPase Era [Sediminibacterium sp.]|uniref:GTPase Era n=1 Tax=Sediminibacterium sp. TaxID=1917865 RepID=UPI0008B27B5B|nr:GTPase Era [Sediminibacterium sp.]MBT9485254.1 GTPase Era [Sediminibacterium sp.]OHC84098.1 MAG: GTPase Era [Sphingobacteriia bacterium RIFOXYC2_FULL_35_18]OHC87855.1 MAG: GTPase Era [Sphingobacteriia bacterium RIFOXYD2_FULL_35_12]HLD52111.1 GTPase Era [Sediminibacterium sp.]
MKAGFVNIFGKPNAGKSTLLNALIGEKMAIVSPKVQTTRHRIKAFLNKPGEYQIIFSDTPGIIDPKYKLHQKMMDSVKGALEDADLALLMVDANDNFEECDAIFSALKLKVPALLILNKIDIAGNGKIAEAEAFFSNKPYCKQLVKIGALQKLHLNKLLAVIVGMLPEGVPFYNEDDLSDLPTRFFVSEMIREKIYELFADEIPYHTAVLVNEYKDKGNIVKIQADIIVHRETQKAIIIGEKGSMIRQIGIHARKDIEAFVQKKIFLELFVKVRPKWRDNDLQLKEYGYQ